ncbi:MAG: aminotransferase class I/II-fold pyridoxal phosphate-dependent enzyme [Gammaproteobacteria bacterium]
MLTSGRTAIATIIASIGAGSGDEVLLPAYHCRAMVEPVRWTGATPVLYRLNPDLSIDIDDLRTKISDRTRGCIIVHYFGFPQELSAILTLCREHGVPLIEDCAHAMYGDFDGLPPGAGGDYAIASMTKFFPVADGGCLVSARHELDSPALRAAGGRYAFKSCLNLVERAVSYDRLRPLNHLLAPLLRIKDLAWTRIKATATQAANHSESSDALGFSPDTIGVRMSTPSRFIFRRTAAARLVSRRRNHYRFFCDAFAGLPNCRPLVRNLPAGIVPYVFPLVVDVPQTVFPILKFDGVPMFRWEDIPDGICDVSTRYSRQLLQLCCHQDLRDSEIEWMAAAVRRAVNT